jgi:glycosyltransferase involved in cell wall biosynthesis
MKVLIVVDKIDSAIGRLAEGQSKINTHHNIRIIDVHPKRPSPDQMAAWEEGMEWADVIDFQYWKTALMLMQEYTVAKPKILQHHNPYSIKEADWKPLFDLVVVNNKTIQNELPYAKLIHNMVDVGKFEFVRARRPFEKKKIGMVSSRIEAKKGVLEVAEACLGLGLTLQLVGRISDRSYFDKVMDTGAVEFLQNVSEQELVASYYGIDALIVNSIDNFESGPLPALEAMACGTPVIARLVGMLPDIYNKNMVINDGTPGDIVNAIESFYKMDKSKVNEIVTNGWESVKRLDERRRAREYSKVYYSVYSSQDLVSVIVPTANREKELVELVASINNQTYRNLEVVIADDGNPGVPEPLIDLLRSRSALPIKYVSTGKLDGGYNLAKARNLAVAEAEGRYLVFCDDRFVLQPDNIAMFALRGIKDKEWHFGRKGGIDKKGFVENFSFVNRREFINAGMFNSLIDRYGGMTQEVNHRFTSQGFSFVYRPEITCNINRKASSRDSRKKDILEMKTLLYKLYE